MKNGFSHPNQRHYLLYNCLLSFINYALILTIDHLPFSCHHVPFRLISLENF